MQKEIIESKQPVIQNPIAEPVSKPISEPVSISNSTYTQPRGKHDKKPTSNVKLVIGGNVVYKNVKNKSDYRKK